MCIRDSLRQDPGQSLSGDVCTAGPRGQPETPEGPGWSGQDALRPTRPGQELGLRAGNRTGLGDCPSKGRCLLQRRGRATQCRTSLTAHTAQSGQGECQPDRADGIIPLTRPPAPLRYGRPTSAMIGAAAVDSAETPVPRLHRLGPVARHIPGWEDGLGSGISRHHDRHAAVARFGRESRN